MSRWYWLVDGEIVPAPAGSYLQEGNARRIGRDEFGDNGAVVSTVFLGFDHGYGDGPPVLFETMVFWHGAALDNEQERYTSLADAKAGHERWVRAVKIARVASFVGAEPTHGEGGT